MGDTSRWSIAAVIWMLLAALYLVFGLPNLTVDGQLAPFLLMTAGAIAVTGVLMSLAMLRMARYAESLASVQLRLAREQYEKPKHGNSLAQLMAVLDDADAEELRLHIKRRLMEQVDSGSTEFVETFEDLLAGAKRKQRETRT